MAEVLINSLDAGNLLYLQDNDHYNMPINGFKLLGSENYKIWSTAMKIALKGKNKIGFIDGQVYSKIVYEVWDELEKTYDKVDGSIIFNIVQKINCLKQGLNDVYQLTKSNLLARDPLPDVKEAFAVVSREETHMGLAPGKIMGNNNNNNNRGPNPNLVCKHCGLIGHTIERCYELNGYPTSFKRNSNLSKQSGFVKKFSGNNVDVSQNASTSSNTMSASFTNEQMMKLLSLINEIHAANVSDSMAVSKEDMNDQAKGGYSLTSDA
nr:hypothetical protein [Tanacetum cinerariifolium]